MTMPRRLVASLISLFVFSTIGQVAGSLHPLRASSSNHNTTDAQHDADETPSGRIISGQKVPKNDFRYFVRLERHNSLLCGGSLIHSEWVLTAAHCFSSSSIIAKVGINNLRDNAPEIRISRYVPHPSFHDNIYHDFMLLRLQTPVLDVEPVHLNKIRSMPKAGEELTVMGMGSDTVDEYFPTHELREATIEAYSHRDCQNRYDLRDVEIDKQTMLCAGLDSGGVDSCIGDSGSPILDKETGTQVGIVSFGYSCAHAIYPGVYSKVSAVSKWIEETICEYSVHDEQACEFIKNRKQPKASGYLPNFLRVRSRARDEEFQKRQNEVSCQDTTTIFPVNSRENMFISCAWLAKSPAWQERLCTSTDEEASKECQLTCRSCESSNEEPDVSLHSWGHDIFDDYW